MMNEKEVIEMKEELRKEELIDLEKRVKSLDSKICRLKKMEYDSNKMKEFLEERRIYREVVIEKKEKKVVIYDREKSEIDSMSFEEVVRGIRNVDSIKCIELGKNEKFRSIEKLEKLEKVREWLIDRKGVVDGNSMGKVKVSDVMRVLEDIESIEDLKKWLENK